MEKQAAEKLNCDGLSNDMTNAVDKVEALFRKAESDLEYMSRKLEDEFRVQLGDRDQLNPKKLMERLQRVKKEYTSLVQEAEGIKAMQSEMASYLRSHLQRTCMAMKTLQENAPQAQITDSSEQEAVVDSVLGLKSAEPTDPCQSSNGHCKADGPSEEPSERQRSSSDSANTASSQATKRTKEEGFTAISEEEFQSVSPLIKQRAKLSDVNTVYRLLFEHFKTNPKTESVSIQEMSKLGLRITGATGEAKLKVLRALKILNISTKSGAVKLL